MKNYKYKFAYIQHLRDEAINNLKTIDRNKLTTSGSFVKWKGGKLLMRLRQSSLMQRICSLLKIHYLQHIFSKTYEDEIEKTLDVYLSPEERKDVKLCDRLKKDIKVCNNLIMASPYEYFLLGLRNKSRNERMEFITDKYMLQTMSIYDNRRKHDTELNDKYNFYTLAKPFFNRKVIKIVSEANRQEYLDIVKTTRKDKRLIFKPIHLGCGEGIFIGDVSTSEKANRIFKKIISIGGEWIAEELIKQSSEMAQWNKTSVNTIRILSFSGKDGISFTTSFMRTGREGKTVDNAALGGIYAAIDDKTGIIISDGRDEHGHYYLEHPDSHLRFKGWQVPRYEELKEMTVAIHSTVFPCMKYVAWDFALTPNGWVIIEGNWGQFVCNQSATGKGLRSIFDMKIKES